MLEDRVDTKDRVAGVVTRRVWAGPDVDFSTLVAPSLDGRYLPFVDWNTGDLALRDLAAQFLTLAEKQTATAPLMIGHRLMGVSLSYTGDVTQGRIHSDRALALYA